MQGTPLRGRRHGLWPLLLLALAAALAFAGGAASRTQTGTSLPIWTNLYDWPLLHHGYAGWHQATSSTTDYGLEAGLGGRPGLWLWPKGGHQAYAPGDYAEWTYTAPGTTRLQSALLSFDFSNKLLAHHCIDVGLRDASGTVVDQEERCKPGDGHAWLSDPADDPTSKVLFFRIRVDCGGAPTCSRTIPALDPLKNGAFARLDTAAMTLVDDDAPNVTVSGPFADQDYVNGSSSYGLTVNGQDDGAGIVKLELERADGTGVASSLAPCDLTHHTDALDARICPDVYSFDTSVDTSPLPEGFVQFVAKGIDPALNVGLSEPFGVYVDRTPPPAPTDFGQDDFDETGNTASISWDPGDDPDLADGSPGSGVDTFSFRDRLDGGGWTDWADTDSPGFDVGAAPGTQVDVEATTTDGVGNVSPVGAGTVVVTDTPSVPVPSFESDTPGADADGSLPADSEDASTDIPDDDFGGGTPSALRSLGVKADAGGWCSSASVPGVAWKPCFLTKNDTGIKFRTTGNGSEYWGIRTQCLDSRQTLANDQRKNVGPGYISYVARGAHVLVDDYHVYTQTTTGAGVPDSSDHGYVSFANGGLGAFAMHFAYGVPGHTPAGLNPDGWAGAAMTDDERDVTSNGGAHDARIPPVLEGRMCSGGPRESGVYGIVSSIRPVPGGTKAGERFMEFSVTIKIRAWDPDTASFIGTEAPDGKALLQLTYLTHVERRGVKVYEKLTSYPTGCVCFARRAGAAFPSGAREALVKEPKYVLSLRSTAAGGLDSWKYSRISAWFDYKGTQRLATAVMKGQPQGFGLNTGHTAANNRDWVRWDHGTSLTSTDGCSTDLDCFNAVAKAARTVKASGRGNGSGNFGWVPPATVDWERNGAGLDRWAVLADSQAKAYPHDTLGDAIGGRTSTCGADTNGKAPASLSNAEISVASQQAHTTNDSVRYWEMSGFKSATGGAANPLPYLSSYVPLHGWRGEAGPYDCEPLERQWLGSQQTFVNYAAYFFGNDFTPTGFSPLH
jgi:hypothetical protein